MEKNVRLRKNGRKSVRYVKKGSQKGKDMLEKTIEEESAEDFPQIEKELTVHMEAEEEYFYPELKKEDDGLDNLVSI